MDGAFESLSWSESVHTGKWIPHILNGVRYLAKLAQIANSLGQHSVVAKRSWQGHTPYFKKIFLPNVFYDSSRVSGTISIECFESSGTDEQFLHVGLVMGHHIVQVIAHYPLSRHFTCWSYKNIENSSTFGA